MFESIAHQYRLKIGGASFQTPYWINWSTDEFRLNAPYRGKGTPGQITTALKRAIALSDTRPTTPDEYRMLMRKTGLGVDCSGFVYYVLSQYLARRGLEPLSTQLYITQAEIDAAIERHPERAYLVMHGQPTTLEAVCRTWHKHPSSYTNVARLVDPVSVDRIETMGEIRPGDMIKMTGSSGDHIAVVVAVSTTKITYAQSIYRTSGLGGVEQQTITINDPKAGLANQYFPDVRLYDSANGDGVYRLKVLNRG